MKIEELDAFKRFIFFILRSYFKNWYKANMSLNAPRNDLTLLKEMHALVEIIPITANEAEVKKLMDHLWYLSERLIAFALFDPHVPLDTKKKIVQNMNREIPDQKTPNRFILPVQTFIYLFN